MQFSVARQLTEVLCCLTVRAVSDLAERYRDGFDLRR